MNNSLYDFKAAIHAAGLEPPKHIEPGKVIRFAGSGKRPSNSAAWCLLFNDGLGGCFGDWSTGLNETWQAKREQTYTQEERAAFNRQVTETKDRLKAEQKAKHIKAAQRAVSIWDRSSPAPANFPYLLNKGIQPHEARFYHRLLVLPVIDIKNSLTSLQFIANDGGKKLLSGGQKQACFIPVAGSRYNFSKVVICEGWATGCTLACYEPGAFVVAAIDAGNLQPVATQFRLYYPHIDLIVAGDDDRQTQNNPGKTKALSAAIAADALLAMPQWPKDAPEHLTDFNDLAIWLKRGQA